MKSWLSNLLQDGAFPAVVLAFACAPLNRPLPDVRTNRAPDQGLRLLLDRRHNDAAAPAAAAGPQAQPLTAGTPAKGVAQTWSVPVPPAGARRGH